MIVDVVARKAEAIYTEGKAIGRCTSGAHCIVSTQPQTHALESYTRTGHKGRCERRVGGDACITTEEE